ncbi:MAG: M28 family peptidase, partial [Algicola sp.]|nr:M28 family peptidase [Algicola sp.]
HYISESANENFTNLELDYRLNSDSDPNQYYSRSDHYNFAQYGIPVIFYFNGTHEDYHEPTDTAEKINYPLLRKRTVLIFATAWYIANNEKRIEVDQDS